MYHVFTAPGYGIAELTLDDWSGALRVALERTITQLQIDPCLGETDDPLKGYYVLGVDLFQARIRVDLYYHVAVGRRTIELLDVRWAK